MADQPTFTPTETQARLAILRAEQVALRSELQGLLDEDARNGAAPPTEAEWNEPKTLPNDICRCDANIQALDQAAATSRRLASLEGQTLDLIEKLDRCALYGPADSAREAIEKTRALLQAKAAQETR